ncbi:SprB repeat-containing protein, partial [Croceitalea marina]
LVTDVLCNGDSNGAVDLNVSGGLAPYSIVFDGSAPSTQQTYTGLAAGTYTYTVTDSKNCVTTNTVTINEPAVLSLTTAITVDYTCDNDATIDVTATNGGTAPYQYSIDGVNFSGTSTFTGLTDGTYTITVRDANNCVRTSAQTIDPLDPPTDLSFTQTALTCPTLVGDVTVSVTGGNTPFTYEIIAPSGSVTNNGNNATFTGLAPGTYTFQVTDDKNCIITEDYTLDPIPQVDAVSQLVRNVTCVGDTDGEFNFTVSDFDTTYSYIVQDGLGTTVTSANNINTTTPITVPGLAADTYVITITDDVTNCTVTLNQVIAEPATPLGFTFTNTDDTCVADATITVNATGGWGGYEYQLEEISGPTIIYPYQSGNSFADVAPGTYDIYVRDTNGCIVVQRITIDPAETPVIALAPSDLCYDGTDQASLVVNITDGVAPYSYTINGGGLIAASGNPFTIANLTPGTYNIQVTDAYGCVSNTITQTIEPQLTANAVLTQDLFCTANAIIDVTISGGYTPYATYQVQIDGGGYGTTTAITGNSFTYNGAATAGTYQFLITDNNNCNVETNEIIVSPTVNP